MIWLNIIWPVFAMAALTFVVWFVLIWQRLGHIRRSPPETGTFASPSASATYFEPVAPPASNLANLFEMPVLFFVAAVMLIVTHATTPAQVVLAWVYVALRAVHSIMHLSRRVAPRFFAYLASCAVLSAIWIGFFVDMAGEAMRFHQAMQALGQP